RSLQPEESRPCRPGAARGVGHRQREGSPGQEQLLRRDAAGAAREDEQRLRADQGGPVGRPSSRRRPMPGASAVSVGTGHLERHSAGRSPRGPGTSPRAGCFIRKGRRHGRAMMRVLKWIGLGLALVLLLLAGGIYVLVTSPFIKNQIVERSSTATGREVAIDGDVEIDWSLTPRLRLNKVRVANTEWGSQPDMISAERIDVSIKLLDLLRGRVTLPEVRLIKPEVLLEKRADGTPNWRFGENPAAATAVEATTPEDRHEFPIIRHLVIDDGTLDYRDPAENIEISSKVNTAIGTGGGAEQTLLRGNGRFAGKPFTLD